MAYLKIALILILATSCTKRDEEYIWDRLDSAQQTAIQNAANLACTNDTQSLIDSLKASSTASFGTLDEGDYFTFNDGSKDIDVVILRQELDTPSPGVNTLYIFVEEGFGEITDYPTSDNSKDHVFKITTTQNNSQWDQIQTAMCTSLTSDIDSIENTYTNSLSAFNFTLKEVDASGDEDEADISTYVFNSLSNADLPAFFFHFNVAHTLINRDQDGSETTNSSSRTYTLKDAGSFIIDTDFREKVRDDTILCEYSSIRSYSSNDNIAINIPTSSDCGDDKYVITGYTDLP